MYFYKKKWNKLLILVMFLSGTTLMADYINLTGSIINVKDNGQEEALNNVNISINNSAIYAKMKIGGKFELHKNTKQFKIGDKIQLKLSDKNWFIVSPFNGKMFLPNKAEKIKIRVVSKQSRVYAALFTTIRDYSIQVVTTYNEAYAIDTMNALKKDYKDVYYEAHAKAKAPKNGFFYKVKVGHYTSKKSAIADLKKIRKRYKLWKDAFLTVHVQTVDE